MALPILLATLDEELRLGLFAYARVELRRVQGLAHLVWEPCGAGLLRESAKCWFCDSGRARVEEHAAI